VAKRKSHRRGPRKPSRGASGGGTWLYGVHAVLAALENPARVCHRLLIAEADPDLTHAAARAAEGSGVPRPQPEPIDRRALNDLLPPGSVNQGIAVQVEPLAEIHLDDLAKAAGEQLVVVLDQATDPRNVGAVLRSAAAFGAAALIMQDRHAPDATGVLAKAASGALERVPMLREVNLSRALHQLKDNGFWCIGLAGEAETELPAAPLTGRVALVLGAEGAGLRRLTRETCDVLARIPMSGEMESLNLSNAAAVALYEAQRQRTRG
jgi:23S rRNA (guanosine2251-2'-O)-methyltransferase